MTDTETTTADDGQPANELVARLRESETDDELSLRLDDGTEIGVSIVRSLYLPDSVREGVAGGSLRHAVRTSEQAVERLGLPSREGLIAAEETESASWTRPRIDFYDLVTETDDGEAHDDYGDVQRSDEIAGIASS
jgi:hypothetical protein